MAKVKVKESIEDANHVRGDIVTNGHFVLLVTSSNYACISGVVLSSTIMGVGQFSYQVGLKKGLFHKLHGTVYLIQE